MLITKMVLDTTTTTMTPTTHQHDHPNANFSKASFEAQIQYLSFSKTHVLPPLLTTTLNHFHLGWEFKT